MTAAPSMVERVARAICEAERMNPGDALGGWVHWQDAARAAIEAMREPDERMLSDACGYTDFLLPEGFDRSPQGYMQEMKLAWHLMIDRAVLDSVDAALKGEG